MTYRIKNWSRHQSYKDRKPPWIRFHRDILDDYKFQIMSADARAILPMLWLLACEHKDPQSGLVTQSLQEISFRLRQPEKIITKVLCELQDSDFIECIESVTNPLQNRTQTVTPETETETETYKPDWLPEEEWKDFKELRKKLKSPMTDRAEKLAIGQLEKLMKEGNDPKLVIEQSILRGWKGFFPLKEKQESKPATQKSGVVTL